MTRTITRLIVGVVVLGTLGAGAAASAAAGGDGGDQAVRPFREVQDSKIVFEPDATNPTRAIFRVVTTEPMICAIVWGPDRSFGRFNNSLAMNGTGIRDHDVVLPDVEPGQRYHYVVQGTTADGTLYRSKPGTFTIDPDLVAAVEESDVAVGANLALDAEVTETSSVFSKSFAAANAVDDDVDSEWSSRGDGDDGFISLDLGREQAIGAVEFVTRSMPDGSAITRTFTVSVDGRPPLGPFEAGTVARRSINPLVATGRTLRFEVDTSTGGNVGALEVRVFAPAEA
jgi:hypothetical protein